MKSIALTIALLIGLSVGPTEVPHLCVGAQLAIVHATAAKLQERSTPDGEWCQRPETRMPKGAHACECHKASCTDKDPEHLPAHTDAQCLNFCSVEKCSCPEMDCK